MLFTSTIFLCVFLPVVFGLYYFPPVQKRRTFQNMLLFVASLVFYAWGEPVYILLMLFSIVSVLRGTHQNPIEKAPAIYFAGAFT